MLLVCIRVPKVAIFTGSDLRTYGGGEKEAIGIANRIEGYQITLMSFRDITNLRRELDEVRDLIKHSVKIEYYSSFIFNTHRDLNPFSIATIRVLLELRHYDSVYSMHPGFLTNGTLLVLSKIFSFRYIFGVHSPIYFGYSPKVGGIKENILSWLFNKVRKFLISKTRYIRIQNSRDEENLKKLGFTGTVFNVPPYVRSFEETSENLVSNQFKVLFVGRLIKNQKGLDLYISIMEKVLEKDRGINFVIVGSGREGEELLESVISRYPENIHLKGFLEEEELESTYFSSDIFAFPSRSENYGISLCEALLSGLPSVAFNVMGVEEIMVDEQMGNLIEPFDVDAFADTILRFYEDWKNDKEKFTKRKEKIRELAKTNFGTEAVLSGLRRMFNAK